MASPSKGTKRKAKDSNKPKRPISAYFYFLEDCRKKAKEEGRSISKIAEFTKDCSAYWREFTEKDKKKFDEKAAKDKRRYELEMEDYVPSEGEKVSRSKKVKDENRPKRPQSAYFLFLADYRVKMKGKLDNKSIVSTAGAEWSKLNKEQKKPYEASSEVEKKKYDVAMKEYNKGNIPTATAKKSAPAANGTDEDDDDEEEDEEDDDDDDDE